MRDPISLYDALIVKDQDILKLRYGVPGECLGRLGDKLTLNERVADTYVKILCVMKHERQTQVVYNRLTENGFDVNLVYLDKDAIKRDKLDDEAISDIPEKGRVGANRKLPNYSQIAKVEVVLVPFEKTPKMSIKRFMYK